MWYGVNVLFEWSDQLSGLCYVDLYNSTVFSLSLSFWVWDFGIEARYLNLISCLNFNSNVLNGCQYKAARQLLFIFIFFFCCFLVVVVVRDVPPGTEVHSKCYIQGNATQRNAHKTDIHRRDVTYTYISICIRISILISLYIYSSVCAALDKL